MIGGGVPRAVHLVKQPFAVDIIGSDTGLDSHQNLAGDGADHINSGLAGLNDTGAIAFGIVPVNESRGRAAGRHAGEPVAGVIDVRHRSAAVQRAARHVAINVMRNGLSVKGRNSIVDVKGA